MKIALLCGSLRQGSYNRSLLQAFADMLPAGVEIVWTNIDVPLYNQDLEQDDRLPPNVVRLRDSLKTADAIVIGTPEYNYGIPGTVKNAIDWASRPPGHNIWTRKPVGVMGASPGFMGTPRAQQMLKTCLLMVGARVFSDTEILVAHAHERFDNEGTLVDQTTLQFMAGYAEQFVRFVKQQRHEP